MGREGVEQCADALPCGVDGALCGFAQEQLELGEDLLDRVEVGGVGRQEQQFGTRGPDGFANGGTLVAAEVVHDDDIAGRERRDEELGDIGGKAFTVDRPVEHARRIDPVVAKCCKEGERLPFAERSVRDECAAARRPAPDRRHVGLGPGFVDEDQTSRIKSALILLPLRTPPGHRRSRLLLGEQAFF